MLAPGTLPITLIDRCCSSIFAVVDNKQGVVMYIVKVALGQWQKEEF